MYIPNKKAKPPRCLAKINGGLVEYTATNFNRSFYQQQEAAFALQYIGQGDIHSIDGMKVSYGKGNHFWI